MRVNGLFVLLVLVAVGMGATSVLFKWRSRGLYERMMQTRADTPGSGEPRLEAWLQYGGAINHRGLVSLRFSPREPWLVTHTVGPDRDRGEVEIWGVDLAGLDDRTTTREGMTVVLTLPAPRLLARGEFGAERKRNDKARNVPHFAARELAPDPRERASFMIRWALQRVIENLERDVAGASFEVRFEDVLAAPSSQGATQESER